MFSGFGIAVFGGAPAETGTDLPGNSTIYGARLSLQISLGAPTLVDVPEETIDPIEIAIMEYDKGVVPMTVKRD